MKAKRKVFLIERWNATAGAWEILNLKTSVQHWPTTELRGYMHREDAKKAMDYFKDTQCATSWKFRVVGYIPLK